MSRVNDPDSQQDVSVSRGCMRKWDKQGYLRNIWGAILRLFDWDTPFLRMLRWLFMWNIYICVCVCNTKQFNCQTNDKNAPQATHPYSHFHMSAVPPSSLSSLDASLFYVPEDDWSPRLRLYHVWTAGCTRDSRPSINASGSGTGGEHNSIWRLFRHWLNTLQGRSGKMCEKIPLKILQWETIMGLKGLKCTTAVCRRMGRVDLQICCHKQAASINETLAELPLICCLRKVLDLQVHECQRIAWIIAEGATYWQSNNCWTIMATGRKVSPLGLVLLKGSSC